MLPDVVEWDKLRNQDFVLIELQSTLQGTGVYIGIKN